MSKEIKCTKCNRDPNEVKYHISSEKLVPKNSTVVMDKVLDIVLCEDCYEQEKSKYLNNKKEYYIGSQSGGMIAIHELVQNQKNSTKISQEFLETFKKIWDLKSIHYNYKEGSDCNIEIIDKDGNKVKKVDEFSNPESVWGKLENILSRSFKKSIVDGSLDDLEEYLKENNIVKNDDNIERERERTNSNSDYWIRGNYQ